MLSIVELTPPTVPSGLGHFSRLYSVWNIAVLLYHWKEKIGDAWSNLAHDLQVLGRNAAFCLSVDCGGGQSPSRARASCLGCVKDHVQGLDLESSRSSPNRINTALPVLCTYYFGFPNSEGWTSARQFLRALKQREYVLIERPYQ